MTPSNTDLRFHNLATVYTCLVAMAGRVNRLNVDGVSFEDSESLILELTKFSDKFQSIIQLIERKMNQ